jgi:cytidylate kinase
MNSDSALMIAIDGPAAAGKSTIALCLADELGYLFFDTGVMYRAVTLAALQRDTVVSDEKAVTRIATQVSIDVLPSSVEDGRTSTVLLDNMDVTWEIRSPEVEENVSVVSMYHGVREAMSARQREIGLRGRVVMVGRDIGTVVLPEADLKVFLDASVKERAKRRYLECLSRGEDITFEEILASMNARDSLDSTRELAPLVPAEDAVIIDTTYLSIDEVLSAILDLLDDKGYIRP